MKKTGMTLIGLALALVGLVGSGAASAQDPEPWFIAELEASGRLAPGVNSSDGSSGLDARSLTTRHHGANPANCKVKPLWPHPSAHAPGRINAGVQQTCPNRVTNNSVEAKLWEKRWWGYNVIDGPNFSQLRRVKRMTVFVNAPCRNNKIRVTGYGHYSWAGDHIILGEVSKTVSIDC